MMDTNGYSKKYIHFHVYVQIVMYVASIIICSLPILPYLNSVMMSQIYVLVPCVLFYLGTSLSIQTFSDRIIKYISDTNKDFFTNFKKYQALLRFINVVIVFVIHYPYYKFVINKMNIEVNSKLSSYNIFATIIISMIIDLKIKRHVNRVLYNNHSDNPIDPFVTARGLMS